MSKEMKEINDLPNIDKAIILYIDHFGSINRYPPTIRELGSYFDIKSTSIVNYHLDKLRKCGFITSKSGKARTIAVNPALNLGTIELRGSDL